MENTNKSKKTIYCHFSFKRPKGCSYGLFAVAFYSDFEGKKLITAVTRKFDLWQDHQFITAIQSYEHALLTIYEMQGQMYSAGINQVMLVTDNGTLAGWIANPKKNKAYTEWMEKAVKMFRPSAPKEIVISIGLCQPRKAEKSYKYCKEDRVSNVYKRSSEEKKVSGYVMDIKGYKSILDVIAEDEAANVPEIIGLHEIG